MSAAELRNQLQDLETQLKTQLEEATTAQSLEELRHDYLGKKGKLTAVLKGLGKVTPEERAEIGKAANELKAGLDDSINDRAAQIEKQYYQSLADTEWRDMTQLPAPFAGAAPGHIHPISAMQRRLEEIFTSMGFSILDGPQVETDFHNFGALNFTDDHPAREMQDTFYTAQQHLLRTHTSPVQIRGMKLLQPPMRIIAPGRVFRYEELDASHEHTFYQMEGMVIAEKVSVGNLLYLMHTLLEEIFEQKVDIKLRPGYFPFVEPGFELDMKCQVCSGKGCPVCKYSGWSEVMPCGLVHPNVIQAGGLDPEKWQGAAFGLGLNRLVMMRYAIEDIRHFQGAKPAFLYQFQEQS